VVYTQVCIPVYILPRWCIPRCDTSLYAFLVPWWDTFLYASLVPWWPYYPVVYSIPTHPGYTTPTAVPWVWRQHCQRCSGRRPWAQVGRIAWVGGL